MNNSTNSNLPQKDGQTQNAEAHGLLHGQIKIVKNYLDKLPENCEKVSSQSIQKVFDFAKSYRVEKTKKSGPVEYNLN